MVRPINPLYGPIHNPGGPPKKVGEIREKQIQAENPSSPKTPSHSTEQKSREELAPNLTSVEKSKQPRVKFSISMSQFPPEQQNVLKSFLFLANHEKDYTAFNKLADVIKTNPNWSRDIITTVKKLSKGAINSLLDFKAIDLRGFDKEVAQAIFSSIPAAISSLNSTDLGDEQIEALADIADSLNAKVFHEKVDLEYLGGGAVNSVYKLTYKNNTGETVSRYLNLSLPR